MHNPGHRNFLRASGFAFLAGGAIPCPSPLMIIAFLELIRFIQKWKSTGMPIKDIIRYIKLLDRNEDSYKDRLDILEKHRERIEKQIKQAEEFLNIINYKIEWYKKNSGVLNCKKN
jgi:hypothetical protein